MVISNNESRTEGSVGSIDNRRVRDATGAFSAKASQVVPRVLRPSLLYSQHITSWEKLLRPNRYVTAFASSCS